MSAQILSQIRFIRSLVIGKRLASSYWKATGNSRQRMATRCKRKNDGNGEPKRSAVKISVGKPFAQIPFAAVLGCADARVPPEIVFGKSSNELFVVRVAGNLLGQNPKVVFGTYDLISGRVRLPLLSPSLGEISEDESRLFPPPSDAKGFRHLALRICQGRLIQSLLKPAHRRSA
jgi:hypothetical protein